MTHPDHEPCIVCASKALKALWEPTADGKRHVAGFCAGCGRFRLWLPTTPTGMAEADANEPKEQGPGLFDDRDIEEG